MNNLVTYIRFAGDSQGKWFTEEDESQGNPLMLRSMDQGAWLGCNVFDGARYFEGVFPDVELHCARVIESARRLKLNPSITTNEIVDTAWQAVKKFPKDALLYVRPQLWAQKGITLAEADHVHFSLAAMVLPWPKLNFTACLSSYRKPDPRSAPTTAKAVGLYANVHLMQGEAKAKGFDTALALDLDGNVAEFASTNLFYAKGGVVYTPKPNSTFLNGITRQRIMGLLREAGVEVQEKSVSLEELLSADEVFATGNLPKVLFCGRIDQREFTVPGPIASKARQLYWEFAHGRLKTQHKILI